MLSTRSAYPLLLALASVFMSPKPMTGQQLDTVRALSALRDADAACRSDAGLLMPDYYGREACADRLR